MMSQSSSDFTKEEPGAAEITKPSRIKPVDAKEVSEEIGFRQALKREADLPSTSRRHEKVCSNWPILLMH